MEDNGFPDVSIITIVLEPDKDPEVDLGDIDPWTAVTIFASILDALKDIQPIPNIKWRNPPKGASYNVGYRWSDDDDDDDEDGFGDE